MAFAALVCLYPVFLWLLTIVFSLAFIFNQTELFIAEIYIIYVCCIRRIFCEFIILFLLPILFLTVNNRNYQFGSFRSLFNIYFFILHIYLYLFIYVCTNILVNSLSYKSYKTGYLLVAYLPKERTLNALLCCSGSVLRFGIANVYVDV